MADDTVIKVDHVSKTFKLPHEKTTSIKSAVVNFHKRKRTYEKQQALKDVSFEINRGEFFGIVGRNGGGKSTLLKLLAGIYTPSSGTVAVNGKLTPFIELGVGFNPELTGQENVFLNGALLGFNRKEVEAMYPDIVEFAELGRFMDQKLKNYSSGMQVRLAFSIAIRAQSDILLLDEVLAVGDASFQQKCFNYFEELKRQNKTVVFVSHDMGAVRRFCTRAVYIKEGELVYDGSPLDIADMYLADNLEHEQSSIKKSKNKDDNESGKHKLTAKILKQTDRALIFQANYESKAKEPMYIGISIFMDGAPIAEITSPLDMKLTGQGKVTYDLDTTILNGGVYEITMVLCSHKNRKLLSIGKDRLKFIIKGNEITRGGAIKLADTWKQTK